MARKLSSDATLFAVTAGLLGFGLVMVWSASLALAQERHGNPHYFVIKQALWEANICFMMAPRHHSAMRHVGPTRIELGTRTIFNLMGPLSNPAGAKRQLTGVFSRAWIAPMAEVLGKLGSERAWVVHGGDGIDELTTTGPSYVAELKDGKVTTFEVTPEEAGLPRATPSQEAAREFRVLNSTYLAEYGRALGGFVNIVTKSGTNQRNGSIYYFGMDDALAALVARLFAGRGN